MSSDLLLVRQQTFPQLVVLRLELLPCGGHVLGCVVVHGSKVSPEPDPGKGRAETTAPATAHGALGEGCGCCLRHEGAAPGHRDLGRWDGSVEAGPRFGSESRSLVEANSGPSGLCQNGWPQTRRGSRRRLTEGVAWSLPQLPRRQAALLRTPSAGVAVVPDRAPARGAGRAQRQAKNGFSRWAWTPPSVSLTPPGSRSAEILGGAPPPGGRHREPAAYAGEAAARCWRRRRARR